MSRKARKFKAFFRPTLGDLQKKKKKVFAKIQSDFSADLRNSKVFSAQNQVIYKKKKKRSSPKLRLIFCPISQIQTFEGDCFQMGGGLFSIFHIKSASKAQKTCDFAYFTSQWGGSSPPPPPRPWLRYCVQCGILKAAELTAALELDKKLFIKFSSHSAKVGALAEISPIIMRQNWFKLNLELSDVKIFD